MSDLLTELAQGGVVQAQRVIATERRGQDRRVRDMQATMLWLDGLKQREVGEFQGCTREGARLRIRRGSHPVAQILESIRA